jgi:hypothetical protein
LDFREKNNVDRKDFLDNMMVLRKRGQEANGAPNVVSEYLNLQLRNNINNELDATIMVY